MFDYSFKPMYTTLNSSLEPSTESRVIHNQKTLLKQTFPTHRKVHVQDIESDLSCTLLMIGINPG